MRRITEGLYSGTVVHARLRPVRHRLSYRVFSVLFDCARLDVLDKRVFFFSYNRFNLFSLYDRDHGDGSSLGDYLRSIAARSGQGNAISRFVMLCYPRILGYGFNPLTVFFGLDADDEVLLVVYEVRNTFGERQTYVLPVERQGDGVIAQSCLSLQRRQGQLHLSCDAAGRRCDDRRGAERCLGTGHEGAFPRRAQQPFRPHSDVRACPHRLDDRQGYRRDPLRGGTIVAQGPETGQTP